LRTAVLLHGLQIVTSRKSGDAANGRLRLLTTYKEETSRVKNISIKSSGREKNMFLA
jgi:hypothetical protein